ncbi:MAG TPA: ATP-binding protein [Candidatus Acidoferrales bacterium]|nr:ATP-binding protein [Candidatus Acidoferrales bacterium]
MAFLFYARLIALTVGTLVYLFLIALILGHRRPRLFERLLFLLVLALFLLYAGGLLQINAEIQYGTAPAATQILYKLLIALGVAFVFPLVIQTHMEYVRQVRAAFVPAWAMAIAYAIYLLPITMLGISVNTARSHLGWGLLGILDFFVREPALIVASAMAAALLQTRIAITARERTERGPFWWLFISSLIIVLSWVFGRSIEGIEIAGVLPGAVLVRYSLRRNFLEYGAQRNMVYALSATLLALLYLALVHRISGWLAPVFPPEATASVLLFVLIFLFEPMERVIGPALHRTFRERMDSWQRLAAELQDEARHGEVARLMARAEQRIREEFGLAAVCISLPRAATQKALESPGGLGHVVQVPLRRGRKEIGMLEAASSGSYLTGETTAALEFLAEQLPAMVDLARLIEEKLRLERELAGRERLALLGQMAASVSHNLRNPLSSMKTVLQVQLEKPDLPAGVRHDSALVLGEIDRMNTKLTQLLHFAKPSVNGQRIGAVALAKQTAELFRHDAERRQVILDFHGPAEEVSVLASEEALGEVLSNLVVNAIEAQPNGGRVRVELARAVDHLEIGVEDDGPGITPEVRAKIFQPFFTTKATGTGLGLAIVARRVDEMGGTMSCESPIAGGKGTRFRVRLPVVAGDERSALS